jgi:deoxyadenosine/deoxycytidine kinase
MELYEKISGYIPIPNLIIVLDVNYEECRRRIGMKSKTLQTLDQVPQREYAHEMEFYYHLNTCNENVVLFDSNNLSVEQTVTAIKEIVSKNMN